MKQINVISDVYKNQSVNFNGFIVKFNIEGKGIIQFEEKQTEDVMKVFNHPHIYEGDKLPVKEKVDAPVENAQENKDNSELKQLMESNKNLALENANLKKENEELKKEKETLENKICELIQAGKINKEETSEGDGEGAPVNENGTEGEGTEEGKEEESLQEQLEKKTVAQLKEILNSEDFIKYKEEWKGLSKKEDIIAYLVKKTEEEEN